MRPIFFGTQWSSNTFKSDKITTINSFINGLTNSRYIKTASEYTGSNGRVTASVSLGTAVYDYSSSLAAANGNRQYSIISSKVCSKINPVSPNGFYPVFLDTRRPRSGSASQYCAWHSYISCGGIITQFAFFYNIDQDLGCDPEDTNHLHSQGASALVNVLAHEIIETITDPQLISWMDYYGEEISDKCAWRFALPWVSLSNNQRFKLQNQWSNIAYTYGNGTSDGNNHYGCVSGG